MSFPYYHQLDAMDCGPTCLRMVAKHYGKHYSLETLRQKSFIGREGVSMLGISTAAESIGFRSIGVHISFQQLVEAPLPSSRCSTTLYPPNLLLPSYWIFPLLAEFRDAALDGADAGV